VDVVDAPKRTLVVIKSEYVRAGGVETLLAQLLSRLDRDRFRIEFVGISRNPGGYLLPDWSPDDHRGVGVHAIHWQGLGSAWSAARSLCGLIGAIGADIVYTHDMRANLVAYIARRRCPAAWVAHVHGRQGRTAGLQTRFYETVDALLVPSADRIVVGSHTLRDSMRTRGRPVSVIPNSIVVDRYPPAGTPGCPPEGLSKRFAMLDGPIIGTISRLHPGKGIDRLIEALARTFDRYPDCRGLIVGDGSERTVLQERVEGLGMADRVFFTGHVPDVRPYHRLIDIFVLPSLTESLPIALLEAMAMARPVVASRVGDVGRVMGRLPPWCLVEPGEIGGIERALDRLLADPSLRRELGAVGAETVRDGYSMDRMSTEIQGLLSALAPRQSGGGA